MLRLFPLVLSQGASSLSSGDDKGANEIASWIQEHTNLCLAVASSAEGDPELSGQLKERLAASAARGKLLVSALLAQKGELPSVLTKLQEAAAAQNMVPVAGSARGRIAIPLSGGVRRLDEVSQAPRLRASIASAHSQPQVQMASSLTPSRTYIKKSGS